MNFKKIVQAILVWGAVAFWVGVGVFASRFIQSLDATPASAATPPVEEKLSVDELIEREAMRSKLNPSLIRSLMLAESNGNVLALSNKGAVGLMQVMPFNAKACGLQKPEELLLPEKNIPCGVHILKEKLKSQDWDINRALQAYNGGAGCVNKCRESIEHARKVLLLMATDMRSS